MILSLTQNWAGFDPSFKHLTCLVTLKSCDTTKQSVCRWLYMYYQKESELKPWSIKRIKNTEKESSCKLTHPNLNISYIFRSRWNHSHRFTCNTSYIQNTNNPHLLSSDADWIYIYICVCVYVKLFSLYFNFILFYIDLFWILNYVDIVERKSENRIVPIIGWLGVG